MKQEQKYDYDYIVIGSGFGGSVSALRLAEKGYNVLVIEKGKWYKPLDFAKTNWDLKRWMWMPAARFYGIFKMSLFQHVSILSGVGVGGGSLVYANTLPVPKEKFYKTGAWAHLGDWEKELKPYYDLALKMLGATPNPEMQVGDKVLERIAKDMGREAHYGPTNVAVFFGKPEKTVKDPYFGGEGPERTGCNFCGSCMVGCRVGAKNTLDKNYLYLAQKKGAKIQAETQVYDVVPLDEADGSTGYKVKCENSINLLKKDKQEFTCKGVVFSGGVLGTNELLLKLKKTSLPRLSEKVGHDIRTNSESLVTVTSTDKNATFSKGVAIGSILHTDDNSHVEPVRYAPGNGFWRLLLIPMVYEKNPLKRFGKLGMDYLRHPLKNLKVMSVNDWSKQTQILLFMQTLDSKLKLSLAPFGQMMTSLVEGPAPSSFIPEAEQIAGKFASIVNGKPQVLFNETLLGIPTTAHILGGAIKGKDAAEGVVDKYNRVFGYQNMMVCDGSMVSANPGVNPSLTITALSEHAMSKIPAK
ncbi:MAG: GMC family oxidoreductase [SAR324 cluster bacterium]|nr:GMC family oxidoreductase [SAR324 cluster bacterium]